MRGKTVTFCPPTPFYNPAENTVSSKQAPDSRARAILLPQGERKGHIHTFAHRCYGSSPETSQCRHHRADLHNARKTCSSFGQERGNISRHSPFVAIRAQHDRLFRPHGLQEIVGTAGQCPLLCSGFHPTEWWSRPLEVKMAVAAKRRASQ